MKITKEERAKMANRAKKGGIKRWANLAKEERSKQMSEIRKKGIKNLKKKYGANNSNNINNNLRNTDATNRI